MHKKVFIYLAFVGLFTILYSFSGQKKQAETIDWKDWNAGYPTVVKGAKIGLVDVYTAWCGWCKKMDRDTYGNSTIISKLNKDFISIKFNPEENKTYNVFIDNDTVVCSGPQLLMMLSNNDPGGYPTTFFIVQKQNITHVRKFSGYHDPVSFEKILDTMVYFSKH